MFKGKDVVSAASFFASMQAMNAISAWAYRWLPLIHDLLWVPLALLLAFWLRFNLEAIPQGFVSSLMQLMLVALPVQLAAYYAFGLYRGIWRFASVPDLVRIVKAVLIGAVATFVIFFVWQRLENVPRSVIILYPALLMAGLALPRLIYRWLKDRRLGLTGTAGRRALIVGAGRAGEMLVRDLLKGGDYEPVGFLDDDRKKQGLEIHGVRVLGGTDALQDLARKLEIDIVLLAMPTAPASLMRRLLDQSMELHIPCRTLPSIAELADGRVEVGNLREVRIEDLLGREEVRLDEKGIRAFLKGKRVLVTGAGGSIGSELCRQLLRQNVGRLILLDHGEFNLYRIDAELGGQADGRIVSVLGDIRDQARMRWLFENYRPEIVFNAAAYKHVPLVEHNPAEGIKTNTLGTARLADLAVEYGVEKFVQISTDKAVNPTNVMGASKRAAEIYCQNLDARAPSTAFITTRFGNVLGSAGSVVPLFREQIRRGGPVTVTHPEITRYFMTIPEAVRLILQAGSMGKGGEIFVLDMGEPVKIVDLARQMIRLSGLEPEVDIRIEFTGLRPGEKLYEELFHEAEPLVGTEHPKLLLASSREVDWQEFSRLMKALEKACQARDIEQLHLDLQRLVPEFDPHASGIEAPAAGLKPSIH